MDKQEEWARDLEYERTVSKAEGRAEGGVEDIAEVIAEGIVQSLKSLQAVFNDRLDYKDFNPYIASDLNIENEVELIMDKQEEWARDLEYERARARVEGRSEGRAEGRIEGRAEGRIEGRAEGIVQSLVSLGIPKDTTLKLLQDQLNVSFEEAKELFNKYAK